MTECTAASGTCDVCRAACHYKPGWFKPGEIEKTAELLGISLEELFRTKLAVDWWVADGTLPTTFTIAPAVVGEEAGAEYPANPRGACVFLTAEEQCSIHAAKPYECAAFWCCLPSGEFPHRDMAVAWAEHQAQPAALLGREPEEPEADLFDLLGMMFGGDS